MQRPAPSAGSVRLPHPAPARSAPRATPTRRSVSVIQLSTRHHDETELLRLDAPDTAAGARSGKSLVAGAAVRVRAHVRTVHAAAGLASRAAHRVMARLRGVDILLAACRLASREREGDRGERQPRARHIRRSVVFSYTTHGKVLGSIIARSCASMPTRRDACTHCGACRSHPRRTSLGEQLVIVGDGRVFATLDPQRTNDRETEGHSSSSPKPSQVSVGVDLRTLGAVSFAIPFAPVQKDMLR